MSFTNLIPASELPNFTLVNNWPILFNILKSQAIPIAAAGGTLTIKKHIFDCQVLINEELGFGLKFEDCYFRSDLIINGAIFNKEVWLNRCFIDEDLRINKENNEFKSDFFIINLSVKHKVIISGGDFQDCHWSFKNDTEVYIHGGTFKDLVIGYWGGATIGVLTLELSNVKGLLRVIHEKTTIKQLLLMRHALEANVTFQDFHVNYLNIYNYRNEKGLRISNLKATEGEKPSEFSISESYLGKAEFYSVDFASFQNVYFTDVHLVDCSFVNIKWNLDIKALKGRTIYKTDEEKELSKKVEKIQRDDPDEFLELEELKRDPNVIEYYTKSREVYRQLKYALGKQGDIINEQKFHSKEMLAYNRTISIENDGWTKLIIKLSYWFSDFGQSFTRPFCALLIGHWILLIMLISCGGYQDLKLSIENASGSGFELAFERYFQLINPLRRTESGFEGYRIIIDLAMRIWASYMIYNLIRATRRFIK